MTLDQPQAPDAVLVRRRHVSIEKVEYAKACHKLMLEHGMVEGQTVYPSRDRARWRAKYLIRLIDELELAHRWQLSEHVGRRNGGYVWAVEYLPRRRHG